MLNNDDKSSSDFELQKDIKDITGIDDKTVLKSKKKNHFKLKRAVKMTVIITCVGVFAFTCTYFAYGEYVKYKDEKKREETAITQKITMDDEESHDAEEKNSENSSASPSVNNSDAKVLIAESDIRKIIADYLSNEEANIHIKRIDLDYEDDYGLDENGNNKPVYEVNLSIDGVSYQLDIDATSGEILKNEIN